MASKKSKIPPYKNGPQQPAQLASAPKMPSFLASILNASKVLDTPAPVALTSVEPVFLEELAAAVPIAVAEKFTPWLEKFSAFCKELEKKNEALGQERTAWLAQVEADKQSLDRERSEQGKQREDAAQKLEQERAAMQQQREQVKIDALALKERETSLARRYEELASKHAAMLELEFALEERELDARNGFARTKQQLLDGLKTDIRTLEATRDQLHVEIERHKGSLNLAQQERDTELTRRAEALEAETAKIERLRQRLQRDTKTLEDERQEMQEDAARILEDERDQHHKQIERLNARVARQSQELDEERRQGDGLRALREVFGERDPQALLDELCELQRDNGRLRSNGLAEEAERLESENQGLRERFSNLQNDMRELMQEHERAKAELSRKRMGALDLETLSMEKRSLEKHKQLLGAHLHDLETRVDNLTASSKTQSPFPQLTAMDEKHEFRTPVVRELVPDDLAAFASEMQHRIALAEKGTRLYYRIDDIRTLLAGLAMSQLHVFQGISGTGKTSLAKAFAKAMGGFCTDIAVQAGWRDRDDLLGHYNAFEKRFYEKDCLQALYQAQTEAWSDRCNVILLDEMNLSRPEQYFAEFLSALEKNTPSERLITLSEHAVPQAPRLLAEQRRILVPRNVWFIGTANHDETTNELADKTYDRAHVMTLPRHEERFEPKPMEPVCYSYASLRNRFNSAVRRYAEDVDDLLMKLQHSALTPVIEKEFGLGWGNRFERQAKHFIPVMIASGASKQDALDHLLSTRVMRSGKVTGRYDIGVETMNTLQSAFDAFCRDIGGDAPKSRNLIEEDRRRKERMT